MTGYHRDYARRALRAALIPRVSAPRAPRPPKYGAKVVAALEKCWAVLNAPAGKRLAPMLAELVAVLRRHHELIIDDTTATLLMGMSPATIDWRLVAAKSKLLPRGRSHTKLPATVTWTTRLPRNAVLYHRAPARTGKRGRPRVKGDRIVTPAQAAATAVWRTVSVARYGRSDTVSVAVLDCLWYGVFGPVPVRMVLVRDREKKPLLALITTDLGVTAADLVARYAARWAIEVTFFDTRQTLGVGQARNRTSKR